MRDIARGQWLRRFLLKTHCSILIAFSAAAVLLPMAVFAQPYRWLEGEKLPAEGLANPYGVSDLQGVRRKGLLHALYYPVDVTGALLPLDAITNFVSGSSSNILRKIVEELFQGFTRIHSIDDVQVWMGLHKYPATEGQGAFLVPFRSGSRPDHRMGFTPVEVSGRSRRAVNAFTFSCAACHSANLFGRQVLGLTNRFPRANEIFVRGVKVAKVAPPSMFDLGTGASDDEVDLYRFTRDNLKSVEPKKPSQLGLDTSLAHTALSLSHRSADLDATKSGWYEKFPRRDPIRNAIADSKPAVWWNVKYKNKWLLDGSVVSGNPIFTNLLWNEIGRGTELVELREWLKDNSQIIEELTTAVYASEAPHITDYFASDFIKIDSAQRGQKLFEARCQKCHGEYQKGWSNPALMEKWNRGEISESAFRIAQLKTEKVIYFEDTPVRDVGTDPQRYQFMSSLTQLNDLRISKENGIKVKVQKGYVPPPLVGIWARYPYFHNNSAPTLCDVLTPGPNRPKSYWARPAQDQWSDFDHACNGYPRTRRPDLGNEYLYRAGAPGLSNLGHDERILVENGREVFTAQDKHDLIQFLQTL